MKRIRLVVVAGMVITAWGTCAVAAALRSAQAQTASQTAAKDNAAGALHQVYGTISHIEGSQLTIAARDQHMVQVDATAAIKSHRTIVLAEGVAINVLGSYDAKGVLHAQAIQRAKSSPAGWPPDR
jgi:hypothetical protein